MRKPVTIFTLTAALTLAAAGARADGPYVTLVDDGTIQNHKLKTLSDLKAIEKKVLALYKDAGAPLPEVLSVWSTFDLGGNPVSTIFDPLGAGVKGIGLDDAYPPDGILTSPKPPLQAVLLHNNVLELPARAKLQHVPESGFARYLFLLELSHLFGPALRVPAPSPGALIGFDFHWSFWMDAGGSPSGGNAWKDTGNGTFTALAANPATLGFSMLDLYIMGLATKDEVPPFGVLEAVTPPAGISDPLWGGAYAAHSFPWFDASTNFTVTATRRALIIDEVITANGARDPEAAASPKSWTLGVVLLVSKDDDAAAIGSAQALFDPLASDFAPSFADATMGRGALALVTPPLVEGTGGSGGTGGAGGAGGATSTGGAGGASTATTTSSGSGGGEEEGGDCGCATPGTAPGESMVLVAAIAALVAAGRRSARRTPTKMGPPASMA